MNIEQWLTDAASYLQKNWGLGKRFAVAVALLIAYFNQYGISYRITSGWRSPEEQDDLMNRWKAGDPAVVAKPSLSSKHLTTQPLFGNPGAEAIDIVTSNPVLAGQIAQAIGIEAGVFYQNPDPVHFETTGVSKNNTFSRMIDGIVDKLIDIVG